MIQAETLAESPGPSENRTIQILFDFRPINRNHYREISQM